MELGGFMVVYNIDNPKEIKAIIFDFDDTLYFQRNKEDRYLHYCKNVVQFLTGLSPEIIDQKFVEFNFIKGATRPRLRELIGKFGDYKDKYDKYRTKYFYMPDVKTTDVVGKETLEKYHNKYKIFLVSGEFVFNIDKKADALGIDVTIFDEVVGAVDPSENIEKVVTYQNLMNKYGFSPNQICVIGDRYKVDLEPMIKLNGGGFLVSELKDFHLIWEYLNN